jgi:hypothetical protein
MKTDVLPTSYGSFGSAKAEEPEIKSGKTAAIAS